MAARSLVEQYELEKEIRYVFDGLDFEVKGRIYQIIKGANSQYTWEISHYCRMGGEADVYIPSAPFGNTLQEIEHKLEQYVARFRDAVDWRENTYF